MLCAMESVGPGPKKACVAFWIRGTLGLWFAARGEFPFAECSCQKLVWGVPCDGASALSGRAGSRGMAGAGRRRLSRAQSCFPTKESPWGVGLRRRRPPAKQQGPGSQGQASPALRYGERGAGGENGLRCFLDLRRVGAVVCCPRSVSLCRMQLPEARLGPSVRRGFGAERPSWLRGHGWGLGAEGLLAPNPAAPQRRTRGEWVSGTRDPQQRSRAQGTGAAQPRFALWRAEGRRRKRLALLSGSEARWGCGLLPEESFPLQNAAARSSFGAVGATGPWR